MLGDSLGETLRRIAAEANTADVMVKQSDYAGARECVRLIMGHCSRLYGRLGFLAEQMADARFVAEVDRAVKRSETGFAKPIPGGTPLPLSPDPGSKPPRPRKGKGSQG